MLEAKGEQNDYGRSLLPWIGIPVATGDGGHVTADTDYLEKKVYHNLGAGSSNPIVDGYIVWEIQMIIHSFIHDHEEPETESDSPVFEDHLNQIGQESP